jgi:hypothetical protein
MAATIAKVQVSGPDELSAPTAANGASERAIANQTGHRSMEVLRRYIRHGTLFTDNAAAMRGL